MKQYDNDNDEFSFVSLAVATANVVRYLGLDEKKDEHHDRKPDAGKATGKNTGETAADIERRIRDILAMENRLRRKRI